MGYDHSALKSEIIWWFFKIWKIFNFAWILRNHFLPKFEKSSILAEFWKIISFCKSLKNLHLLPKILKNYQFWFEKSPFLQKFAKITNFINFFALFLLFTTLCSSVPIFFSFWGFYFLFYYSTLSFSYERSNMTCQIYFVGK